jgi:hypothetical protein
LAGISDFESVVSLQTLREHSCCVKLEDFDHGFLVLPANQNVAGANLPGRAILKKGLLLSLAQV